MEYAAEVQGLSKRYEDFYLDHIDLVLPWGSVTGVIGENGAGKTTVIKAMAGIIKPDKGVITYGGRDFSVNQQKLKEEIGLVLGENHFHDFLRLGDLCKIMGNVYKNWDSKLFKAYGKRFCLSEQKKIKDYSKGMKMKLAIAAALSHHPRILLLDEATAGLDPAARDDILDLLYEFIEDGEHSVMLSSHITSDLDKLADYVVMLHQGKVIFSEEKDLLLEDMGVVRCAGEELEALRSSGDVGVIGIRTNAYQSQGLIKNKTMVRRRYPQLVVDDTNLEEIMLFHVRGDVR